MVLKIVGLTSSALLPLWAILTMNIVFKRQGEKVLIGNGDNKGLEFCVRGHGNFVETVPLGLVLIGIAEMQAAFPEWALMILSTALVAGRYFHAYAFIGGLPIPRHLRFRVIGMVTTVTAILTTGGLVCFGSIKQFLA